MSEIGGRLSAGMPEDQQPIKLPPEFQQHAGVRPDEDTARWLRRHLPSGVAVVTAANDGIYYGVTVSAFSYVSLDPLLVFVALGNESQTGDQIQATGNFGVSLLTNTHRFLADRFAGRAPAVDRRFVDVPHLLAETGSPLLADCIAWLDCTVESRHDGGDHVIYIGRALSVGHGTGDETDPLIYFDSSYKRIR